MLSNLRRTHFLSAICLLVAPVFVFTWLITLQRDGDQSMNRDRIPVMGRYGMVNSFDLVDQQGKEFTAKNLESRVWVVNFIFTSCATECPVVMQRMKAVQDLGQFDDRVALVSISVDPQTDNPGRLSRFASKYGPTKQWFFLTGDEEVIRRLAREDFGLGKGYSFASHRSDGSELLVHTQKIAVVDGSGTIRFYENGLDPRSPERVIGVVNQLLRTP